MKSTVQNRPCVKKIPNTVYNVHKLNCKKLKMTAVLFNKRKLLSLKRTACPEIFDYHQILFYCEECVRIAAQSYDQHKFLSANEAQKSFRFSLLRWKETESFQYLIDLKKSSDNQKKIFCPELVKSSSDWFPDSDWRFPP